MKSIAEMKLGLTPCTWQLQSAHNQLENKDVFTISPTSSGKTLTFWIPLEKNQDEANAYGFLALDICVETATDEAFKAIIASQTFTDSLFNITFDEGHCITHVRFHTVSATMPPHILLDVQSKLHIWSYNLAKVVWSNDHPNIHLMEGTPPKKFMLFVNSQDQAEGVRNSLCRDLPVHLQHNILWFHSGMSMQFQLDAMEKLTKGEIWGICCTDAAGMGLDLQDVRLVIQWGYINSLCILMQQLGCAA
ncbi:P-loop containing nucleoside triphosphate hydrolase protein [Suillus weaverae]|nr:P-loop containing nucleoside triphosphate hydrolase protein [Suillus weaverae]